MGSVPIYRRRLLLAALAAAPLLARAQRAERVRRIGLLLPTSGGLRQEAFIAGMRELGWVEGRNLEIELRLSHGQAEALPGLAEELARREVEVLVAGSTIGARAAKRATNTIPIVFAGSSDPVAGGVVTNLARPEGNVTGVSLAFGEGFGGKWLELLKDAVPALTHAAALWSSSNAAAGRFPRELEAAARRLAIRLDLHHAANPPELESALAAIAASGARGLVVTPSPFAATRREHLIRFAAQARLPAIYFAEDFAEAGGLMSYGPSVADSYRRAATYVDRILKGAKPSDLPVEQPTRFDLVVNRQTAKALGLALRGPILLRADRVIE